MLYERFIDRPESGTLVAPVKRGYYRHMTDCEVSFADDEGVKHTLCVAQAESAFHAALLAVKTFRRLGYEVSEHTKIDVTEIISMTHQVTLHKIYKWLAQSPRSPRDMVTKRKLMELVDEKRSVDVGY